MPSLPTSVPRNGPQGGRLGEMVGTMKAMMMHFKTAKTTSSKKSPPASTDHNCTYSSPPRVAVLRGHGSNKEAPASTSTSASASWRRVVRQSRVLLDDHDDSEDANSEVSNGTVNTQQSQPEHGMFGALTSINEDEVMDTFEPTHHAKAFSGNTSPTTSRNIQRRKNPSQPHSVLVMKDNNSWCQAGQEQARQPAVFKRAASRNPTSLLPNVYIAGL